jgi:hypothetical protein
LDIAGISRPQRPFDGASLLPLLKGGASWPGRTLFFQVHRGLEPQRYRNAAVQTDRYKLLLTPGAFDRERVSIPADPIMELYDLEHDPAEQHDLAVKLPAITAELRKRYEAWFEDVKNSRQFTPGVIHLGSDAEPEVVLSRYQDAAYADDKPVGWSIEIERPGRYELRVRLGRENWEGRPPGPASMFVRINDRLLQKKLAEGSAAAVFDLPAGKCMLDVWIQQEGQPREIVSPNTALGDVRVRRLPG